MEKTVQAVLDLSQHLFKQYTEPRHDRAIESGGEADL